MQLFWSDGAVTNHAESWVTGSRAHGYFLRSSDRFWIEARERLHMLLCCLVVEGRGIDGISFNREYDTLTFKEG